MWLKILVLVIGILVVGLSGSILISKSGYLKKSARNIEELLVDAGPQTNRVFRKEDLEGLPSPVQRYLGKVLTEGLPYVKTVRLEQKGELRLGDKASPWKPLIATQHYSVDPPAFVWNARIKIIPFVQVYVVDMYKVGKGTLRAKILSLFTVMDEGPSLHLNSGELMRYLAETVWFPTALLPGEGVVWSPVDENSALANLYHEGIAVSLKFHFNSQNEVEQVSGSRWHRETDGTFKLAPWSGHFSNYQVRNGMRIPLDGEVIWNLPGGDFSYWRGHVNRIEH